jgi:FkbM family methyltransferase
MGLARLIAALPQEFFLTLVDVGSAGGLHSRWRPFAPIVSAILFDPREAASTGTFGPGQTRVYPVALSDRSGEAELYLTRLANMSSFLRPDTDRLARYRKKGRDTELVGSQRVPVEQLDVLTAADGFKPDVVKVDTQGSELMVLKGAEQSLKSVVLAEVEVSFFQRYVDQPVFADVEAWMKAHDFELIELYRLKRYRAANSLDLRRPLPGGNQRSGRVAYGDAIFLRNEASLLDAAAGDGGNSILRAAIALLAYGKSDHAAALLDRGRQFFSADRIDAIHSALNELDRWSLIPRLGRLLSRARD